MVCKQCNAALREGLKFCGSCGASVATANLRQKCLYCGTEMATKMKFCVGCGRPALASRPLQNRPQPLPLPAPLPPYAMPPMPPAAPPFAQNPPFQPPVPPPFSTPQTPPANNDYRYAATSPPRHTPLPQPGDAATTEGKANAAAPTISLSAAIIGVICFFLPWVQVSCVGMRKTVNGVQIAGDMGLGEVWLVLLAMLAAVAFAVIQLVNRNNALLNRLLSLATIGTGLLPLLIVLFEYVRFSNEISRVKNSDPYGFGRLVGGAIENSVSYEFGAYLAIIAALVVALGGAIHFFGSLNQKPRPG